MHLTTIKHELQLHTPNFILNLVEKPYASADTLQFLNQMQIDHGSFSKLKKIIKQDAIWTFELTKYDFTISFLLKHDAVKNVKQLDSNRYEITRHQLPTIIICTLKEYDIGIESLRYAKSKQQNFHAILSLNSKARITRQAQTYAKNHAIKIYYWGELLTNLSKAWNKA
ncbi:hypothetical protein KORDIASMS9_01274 [Kordia sp. SMS9]|nr:hypothetical protein KORDIASMS9_01274 [Kordia sp. SMS9]